MGPLNGLHILEFAGIGPGPLAAMLLGDMGAEVVRIERPGTGDSLLPLELRHDVVSRGRRSLTLDLKHPAHLAVLLRLVDRADGLIEGFRPGVMERLGLGPEVCLRATLAWCSAASPGSARPARSPTAPGTT